MAYNPTKPGGTSSVAVIPVVSTTAYAIGNVVGGLLTFAAALNAVELSGVLQSIQVNCKSIQTATLKLTVFNSAPSASTFTDRAAPIINVADYDKVVAVFPLSGQLSTLGTHTSWTRESIGRAVSFPGTSIFGVLTTDVVMTLLSVSDMSIRIAVLKD